MLETLPVSYRTLPTRKTEAVCVLTHGQDQWATALASFILAKQAGFDMRFTTADAAIPEGDVYLLPCMCGLSAIHRPAWNEIIRRVQQDGATLYLSAYDALLPDMASYAGLEVQQRRPWTASPEVSFCDGASEKLTFPPEQRFSASHREGGVTSFARPFKFVTRACGADVLAVDEDATPMFTRHRLGRGEVFVLNFGMEMVLTINPGSFEAGACDYARFYRMIAAEALKGRVLRKPDNCPALGLTEHRAQGDKVLCVGINHSPQRLVTVLEVDNKVKQITPMVGAAAEGAKGLAINLEPFDGFVIEANISPG